jgi:phosphoadenosine phosphosulfate reductase
MAHPNKVYLNEIIHQISGLLPADALSLLAGRFPGQVTFSSSFGVEDQVISHLIFSHHIPVSVFTLDTGRLFAETYSVWSITNHQYHTQVKACYPDRQLLEAYLTEKGPNAFYESVENRKSCCYIRKVEPLKRALAGNIVWITGLRAAHSPERENLEQIEWDEGNGVIKYHTLLHWTGKEVSAFISENSVPYNPLHDKGFVSIGCAPCTRAIRPGEDFRAGRWWWEDSRGKECGLHVHDQQLEKNNKE